MNATQKKYVISRIHTLKLQKKENIQAHYTIPAVILTLKEKLQALNAGAFTTQTVGTSYSNSYRHNLNNSIIFNEEKKTQIDQKAINIAFKELELRFLKVCDEIMLGDNAKALSLIESFGLKT